MHQRGLMAVANICSSQLVSSAGVETLAFRFEHDAVVLDGWAHRATCWRLRVPLPEHARLVCAGGSVRSDSCPLECPACAPAFVTLLGHQSGLDTTDVRSGHDRRA